MPQDIKDQCRDAYVLAAELTGLTQLVALLSAPIYGFIGERYHQSNIPLLIAAFLGVLGYTALGSLESPKPSGDEGSPWIFFIMALLGLSQIGSIVCSLGLLGRGVLETAAGRKASSTENDEVANSSRALESSGSHKPNPATNVSEQDVDDRLGDQEPLLGASRPPPKPDLKGSIAGVYSLAGGLGILLLTKVGGVLFDNISTAAPFYMLAAFNASLFVIGSLIAISSHKQQQESGH